MPRKHPHPYLTEPSKVIPSSTHHSWPSGRTDDTGESGLGRIYDSPYWNAIIIACVYCGSTDYLDVHHIPPAPANKALTK